MLIRPRKSYVLRHQGRRLILRARCVEDVPDPLGRSLIADGAAEAVEPEPAKVSPVAQSKSDKAEAETSSKRTRSRSTRTSGDSNG